MIVLLGGPGVAARAFYHGLARHLDVGRAVIEGAVPKSQLLRRRVKKLGVATVAGQLAFKALVEPVLARQAQSRVREIMARHGLDDGPIDPARVTRVASVNDPETVAVLAGLKPSVVVVVGTRIISGQVLRAVAAPFVNVHSGITPAYRGVHGGYWALAENDPGACGVTIHLVDEGIDTGGVLAQAMIKPTPRDNFVTYPYLQTAEAMPLMVEIVKRLAAGEKPNVVPGRGESKLRTHPTIGEYLYYRVKRGVR